MPQETRCRWCHQTMPAGIGDGAKPSATVDQRPTRAEVGEFQRLVVAQGRHSGLVMPREIDREDGILAGKAEQHRLAGGRAPADAVRAAPRAAARAAGESPRILRAPDRQERRELGSAIRAAKPIGVAPPVPGPGPISAKV